MTSRTITRTKKPCSRCGSTRSDRYTVADGTVWCVWADQCRKRELAKFREASAFIHDGEIASLSDGEEF